MSKGDIEKGSQGKDGNADAPKIHWHVMSVEKTVQKLRANEDLCSVGLSTKQAADRFAQYGPNKLTEKRKVTLLERIWKQINNVLVLILVIVAIVSLVQAILRFGNVVSNWIQVGLIVGVITVNTWIGIYQEGNAEAAAEALKGMLSSEARVMRDGAEKMIPAQDIVPGDIVILSLGERVPADIRLVEVANLACQEAALTGEAVPIDKQVEVIDVDGNPEQTPLGDRRNMCFSATLVAQGSGVGIVIATGDDTQIGTINKLVQNVEEKKTNVLEQIDFVSKILAGFICVVGLITFLIAYLGSGYSPLDAVSTALICAVAMIPEGLEAIVTMTYSWAVANMAKQNAIIKALPAVETLGSVTVICSDKTGTLTQNLMSLTAFVTSDTRYKVDVNSTNRVNTNFVRDDRHLAERAQHQAKSKVAEIIHDGPNTSLRRRGHQQPDNIFAVDDEKIGLPLESDGAQSTRKFTTHALFDEKTVAPGESPSESFITRALACGVLCSKCVLGRNGTREGEIGNPTEISILRAAYFAGVDIDEMKKNSPIIAEVPFSSEYKFMSTVHEPDQRVQGKGRIDGNLVAYVKGAPDRMIELCAHQAAAGGDQPIDKTYWTEQVAILSSHGLRVLALCIGSVSREEVENAGENLGPEFVNGRSNAWLTMVGLCAIMDPPRPECVNAIKEAHGAGVRVAMITGDHKDTATAIGHMLGIVDEKYSEAVTGPELDAMSDEEIKMAVMTHNVFARASPENKIQIVKALQAKGQVSSMTGDGVNDAPALKAADMGVAMGKEGTDVAREAAEMILADDNFATIITAVREGRVVWDNLRKILLVNTPINNSQGLSVMFGLALGLGYSPLSPIQVLYSNLICAVTLGFVCAIEPAEQGIMDIPPRRVGKRLIGRYLFLRIALGTAMLTAAVVGSAFWAQWMQYTTSQVRAQAMATLDFGAIAITVSARFAYNSSFHPRIFSGNKFCWLSVAIVSVLQVAITYIPGLNSVIFSMEGMAGLQWAITLAFMCLVFLGMEIEKGIRRKLAAAGKDTDDREDEWFLDEKFQEKTGNEATKLSPAGASSLRLVELNK